MARKNSIKHTKTCYFAKLNVHFCHFCEPVTTIVIEHLPAIYTLYYHLNKIYVKADTFVKVGNVIGEVGSTGFSTGPHLHWELRISEIPCNPEQLVTQDIF